MLDPGDSESVWNRRSRQRDLDFARRYGLPVFSIICPPGEDPASYRVGSTAYAADDGIIINSDFLNGLPVAKAIDAATARLVQVGRGEPRVQFRRGPLVVAEAVAPGESDIDISGRTYRFTRAFLTAAALVNPAVATDRRPHVLHITEPEAATRHLLDARLVLRALLKGGERCHRWADDDRPS